MGPTCEGPFAVEVHRQHRLGAPPQRGQERPGRPVPHTHQRVIACHKRHERKETTLGGMTTQNAIKPLKNILKKEATKCG